MIVAVWGYSLYFIATLQSRHLSELDSGGRFACRSGAQILTYFKVRCGFVLRDSAHSPHQNQVLTDV